MFFLTVVINAQTPPDISGQMPSAVPESIGVIFLPRQISGGYITVGRKDNGNLDMDAWLIKTDANGDTLWTKTYGDTYIDEAYIVKQTSDGGYILAGASTAFGWYGEGSLLKLTAMGT